MASRTVSKSRMTKKKSSFKSSNSQTTPSLLDTPLVTFCEDTTQTTPRQHTDDEADKLRKQSEKLQRQVWEYEKIMKEVDEELERQPQKDDLSHEENYEWEGCCRERDSEEESEEEQEEKFSMKALP